MICFRNLYLWYSDTTKWSYVCNKRMLWFAFEIYIFDILIQQTTEGTPAMFRCDLLSKFISLIFWYNKSLLMVWTTLVVICFRNLYLWYSDTTTFVTCIIVLVLWFAFEIYIFDILIQPMATGTLVPYSCDLLSKFISLIFWYNWQKELGWKTVVVICFRNLYLWYSDTTIS